MISIRPYDYYLLTEVRATIKNLYHLIQTMSAGHINIFNMQEITSTAFCWRMMGQRDKLQVVLIVAKTSAKHKTQIKLFHENYFTTGGQFKVYVI